MNLVRLDSPRRRFLVVNTTTSTSTTTAAAAAAAILRRSLAVNNNNIRLFVCRCFLVVCLPPLIRSSSSSSCCTATTTTAAITAFSSPLGQSLPLTTPPSKTTTLGATSLPFFQSKRSPLLPSFSLASSFASTSTSTTTTTMARSTRSTTQRSASTSANDDKIDKNVGATEEDTDDMTKSTPNDDNSKGGVAVPPTSDDINDDGDGNGDDDGGDANKKRKKRTPSNKAKCTKKKDDVDDSGDESENGNDSDGTASDAGKKKKKRTSKATTNKKTTATKKKEAQRITEIDELPKLWTDEQARLAEGSYTFRIASWNVAGLRALVKKSPSALSDLCHKYNLDMLCLQETKLQEVHLEDPKLQLKGLLERDGYDEYWSCSTAKKGYSGTAVFVRRRRGGDKTKKRQTKMSTFFAATKKPSTNKEEEGNDHDNDNTTNEEKTLPVNPETLVPVEVSYKLGQSIDNEGRTVIVDMPWATLVNVYVPNSGQKLERLEYRTREWDKFFLEFMQTKQKARGLPVIWLGDLNIAHRALDIWNDGASHLDKQAGVTPAERASFTEQLEAGFVDAFRRLHPEAKGNYSYWSQRAGNREPNKGLRLDYFVCSNDLFSEDSKVVVRDSYMAMEQVGSDHGPVILELEIKP